jgi:hypothetical protein
MGYRLTHAALHERFVPAASLASLAEVAVEYLDADVEWLPPPDGPTAGHYEFDGSDGSLRESTERDRFVVANDGDICVAGSRCIAIFADCVRVRLKGPAAAWRSHRMSAQALQPGRTAEFHAVDIASLPGGRVSGKQ